MTNEQTIEVRALSDAFDQRASSNRRAARSPDTPAANDPLSFDPVSFLHDMQQAFPAYVRGLTKIHLESRLRCPSWCYSPFEESALSFVTTYAKELGLGPLLPSQLEDAFVRQRCDEGHTLSRFLATWRATKGIFRFDADLLDALISTTEMTNTPSASMLRLPQWCVYIDVQRKAIWQGEEVHGFFAMLCQDSDDESLPTLCLLICTATSQTTLRLPLGRVTLADALATMVARADEVLVSREAHFRESGEEDPVRINPSDFRIDIDAVRKDLPAILNVLLYLCADNADFGASSRPANPGVTKTRRGSKLFCAQSVAEWEVGVRVGTELRHALQAARPYPFASTAAQYSDGPLREVSRPRPHIRNAHWHHFWTGPKLPSKPECHADEAQGERETGISKADRKLIVRWILPTLVNARTSEAVPTVIRDVTRAANDD